MRKLGVTGCFVAALVALPAPLEAQDEPIVRASQATESFWAHWGDGKAELDRYRLTQPRYGEDREGEATWVFVTEDFTAKQNVKSDGGHGDEFPVLKLNDIRQFPTGLYAYSTMTSTFVRLDGGLPLGLPQKVSLTVQEWCGHVYEQWAVKRDTLDRERHSYFDGEADERTQLPVPRRGVLADSLPIVVRGLTGELVAPGKAVDIRLLPRAVDTRLGYATGLEWKDATVRRAAKTVSTVVPAGSFKTRRTEVWVDQALWMAFDVEEAPPRRVVRWETGWGEQGELIATRRSVYWRENALKDEALRRTLQPSAR